MQNNTRVQYAKKREDETPRREGGETYSYLIPPAWDVTRRSVQGVGTASSQELTRPHDPLPIRAREREENAVLEPQSGRDGGVRDPSSAGSLPFLPSLGRGTLALPWPTRRFALGLLPELNATCISQAKQFAQAMNGRRQRERGISI